MDAKLIGSRIRQAREDKGLSQEQLAAAVSRDQRTISEYENGKRKMPATDLPEFAKALGVSVLYFYEDEATHHDLDEVLLLEFQHVSSPEMKQAIIEVVRVLSRATGSQA